MPFRYQDCLDANQGRRRECHQLVERCHTLVATMAEAATAARSITTDASGSGIAGLVAKFDHHCAVFQVHVILRNSITLAITCLPTTVLRLGLHSAGLQKLWMR